MIQVVKAKQIQSKPLRFFIYGEAGSGKTTLIGTAPRPILVIDFEGGSDIIFAGQENVDIVYVYSKEDIMKVLMWLRTQNQYKTIAFDGFSIFSQKIAQEITLSRNKDIPSLYEWNLITKTLKDIILGLLKPQSVTIFTALAKQLKDQNGKVIKVVPDLIESVRRYLHAIVDIAGYLQVNAEKQRKLIFNNAFYETKDRTGKLANEEEPNISNILKKIA